MKRPLLVGIGVSMLVGALLGCSSGGGARTPPGTTPATTPIPTSAPPFSACFRTGSDGDLSFDVSYRSLEPRNEMARIGREADRVFECFREEAERRGIVYALVMPSFLLPDSGEASTGFRYDRREGGSWQRSNRVGLDEEQEVRDQQALSVNQLELMRQAALVIPNLPGQLGLPPSLVCVQADTGTEPNRMSVNYTDPAFWRGEKKQLEAVAAAMRTAAEKAGIREIEIGVRDGERSQRLRIVWQRQRGWLESLMAVEEARPDPQPSGAVVSFQACVEMNPRDGRPFLGVRYRSRLPRNGVKQMAPEAHRVFDAVVEEAERREIVTVLVSPMDARGFSSGLGYYRTEDGLWSRPFTSDVPEKPLGLQEGPPLTPEELESIREAVSAIPNLLGYGGLPKVAYCAGADTGFLPTYVTVEYADPSFRRGDRNQFEAAAAAMRAEAEKAGIREVEITIRDGERAQLYRIRREPDGDWSEPVLVSETAEEVSRAR